MTYRLIDAEQIQKALSWISKYWHRPVRPEYRDARTIDEAVYLLDRYGEGAKILAGGIDVVGLMKNKILMPEVLVNIKKIPHLKNIVEDDAGLDIGTLNLINDIERSALIKDKYPVLFEAARSIASPNVRNMATVGGDLCQQVRCWYYRRSPSTGISFNCRRKIEDGMCYATDGENQYHAIIGDTECCAVCPSDMATVLLALDARIKTVDASGGRIIPIDKFYTTFGNNLESNEVIKGIHVPQVKSGTKQRFLKFRLRKTIDFAIVSVAAIIKLDNNIVSDARIVLGGVSSSPYRVVKAEEVLRGEPLKESVAVEAAKTSVKDALPLSKNGYKVQIAEALVKRAILE